MEVKFGRRIFTLTDKNEYFFLWRELASRFYWYYAEGEE